MRRMIVPFVMMVVLAVVLTGCGCPMCKAVGGALGLGKKGEAPADTSAISQKTCPVMGGTIDANVYTDDEGRRVYFCCPKCIDKFKKNPAEYIAKLDAQK